MANQTVEQAVKQQIKLEIGDDETITFKQKNQLSLKYGLTTPIITEDEINFWENLQARRQEEEIDIYARFLSTH